MRILFVLGFGLRASSDIRVDSCPFVVRKIVLDFADMKTLMAEPAGCRQRRLGPYLQFGRPWLGVPEPGRWAVAFSQVSMHYLFPIFYRTSFTALPGIGAAPTEGIQSVRNDLTNAAGTRKDVR